MNTIPVVWVLMGLRFLGASQDQEGKWLPYQFYQTKDECLAAKAVALNSESIHRVYFDCIPIKVLKQPPSNPDKYCEKHQEWCMSERDKHPNGEDR